MADADQVSAIRNLVMAINAQTQALAKVLPGVQATATSATAGTATLPANPLGFLALTLPDGTPIKVPYYAA